jgi:hypothetical protein
MVVGTVVVGARVTTPVGLITYQTERIPYPFVSPGAVSAA